MPERYSVEDAMAEAEALRQRVEGRRAPDYATAEQQIEIEASQFGMAREFWDAIGSTDSAVQRGLDALAGYRSGASMPTTIGETPSLLVLLASDQKTVEKTLNLWDSTSRRFGALPHFEERTRIVADFADEAKYFSKHYVVGAGPLWRDSSYASGVLLFELKFGKKLSAFVEEILANYPDLHTTGKEISVFGLSGSGKSSMCEAIAKELGDDVIIMDSDTVRFNLLGRMIRDVEIASGASLKEVRESLIHNSISGSLYFALNHISKELKQRGYTVVTSSTLPSPAADAVVYIEHPEGIDPRVFSTTDERDHAAKTLFERTQARVDGSDNFDWEHAETVTDFRKMKPVTVRVPQHIHALFLKNIAAALAGGSNIHIIKNPPIDDVKVRDANFLQQLRGVFM